MSKVSIDFKCALVEYREENLQVVKFTPLASGTVSTVSEIVIFLTSEKNEFGRGEVYTLSIDKKTEEKPKTKAELKAEKEAASKSVKDKKEALEYLHGEVESLKSAANKLAEDKPDAFGEIEQAIALAEAKIKEVTEAEVAFFDAKVLLESLSEKK